MKKNVLCTILTAIILLTGHSFAFADEVSSDAASTEIAQPAATYTLSLDQAIEMAKKASPVLECCDVNKENLRVQLKNARITMKDNKNTPVYAASNFDLVFVKQGYYVDMFTAQYALCDYEKAKAESTIAYDITQKYYNCKNAVALYNSAKTALDRAQENQALVNAQFALGMCTQIDVNSVALAVEQTNANLEKCKYNIEIAEEALKIALGIEGQCVFNLTDSLEPTPFEADLAKDIESALVSRYDVNALKTAAELAQKYYGIADSLDEENTTYYSAYANYMQTGYDYSTGVKNISLSIKNSYYSACDAIEQSALAKKRLELMYAEYETYKLKNEIGMITNLTLSAKADELTECENTYNNALLAQKLAVEKYYYDITTGI